MKTRARRVFIFPEQAHVSIALLPLKSSNICHIVLTYACDSFYFCPAPSIYHTVVLIRWQTHEVGLNCSSGSLAMYPDSVPLSLVGGDVVEIILYSMCLGICVPSLCRVGLWPAPTVDGGSQPGLKLMYSSQGFGNKYLPGG